jgi:cytoskeletal protein CcmA (bactofilin family)
MNSSSIILSDVEVSGTINFKGELTFDGQLHNGDIIGEILVLGPKARIQGNIQAAALTLHGSVTGDVMVTGRCELKGSASLVGSLTTNRLAMDEGATLIGKAEITPDTRNRPTPPSSSNPPAPVSQQRR